MASAVTITVTLAGNAPLGSDVIQGASDVGTLSLTSEIVNNVSDVGTLSYTVSDLNLNSIGRNDDSVQVNFRLVAGRSLVTTNASAGAPFVYQSNTNRISTSHEGLKCSFDSLSVNLDGGTDNGSGSCAGFTGSTLMFPLNKDGDHVAKVNDREIAATDIFQFVALSDVCL
ncbi:MAG: hypothetical protein ACI8Z5_001819 [Lentimonas sp.]